MLRSMGFQKVEVTERLNWNELRHFIISFPGGSDGKESARNAGDLSSIPGSGRSPGERNGYAFQYSGLDNSMDRRAWQATVHGVTTVHNWVTFTLTFHFIIKLLIFVTPWTVVHQAPLSMEFSRQEYWSGLPFPSPRGLPDPGIEPGCPALQADSLPSEL